MGNLAILAHGEAREREHDIEFIAPPGERPRIAGVTHRIHRAVDEHDEVIADLMLVLCARQSIEQPLPFGHAGRRIGYLDLVQQPLDLRPAQTLRGIGKNTAGGFKVL